MWVIVKNVDFSFRWQTIVEGLVYNRRLFHFSFYNWEWLQSNKKKRSCVYMFLHFNRSHTNFKYLFIYFSRTNHTNYIKMKMLLLSHMSSNIEFVCWCTCVHHLAYIPTIQTFSYTEVNTIDSFSHHTSMLRSNINNRYIHIYIHT